MSELEDLIAIYRAIDAAVVAEQENGPTRRVRDIATRYIPQYEVKDYGKGVLEDAAGWIQCVDNFFGDDRPMLDVVSASERADGALINIQESPAPPTGRMQSRLLPPLAAYFHIRREEYVQSLVPFDPGLFVGAAEAFQPEDTVNGGSFSTYLYDDAVFRDVGDWKELKRAASQAGVLLESVRNQPLPCSGSMEFDPTDGKADPVTRLGTKVCSNDITDAQVQEFLEPTNWKGRLPLYCEMRKDGKDLGPKGGKRYIEELSFDCATGARMIVCLVFRAYKTSDTCYSLHYDLCTDKSVGNGKVDVDHGAIIAEKTDDTWCFNTTKWVRFTGIASGAIASLVACALGYASYAEDFIHSYSGTTPGP